MSRGFCARMVQRTRRRGCNVTLWFNLNTTTIIIVIILPHGLPLTTLSGKTKLTIFDTKASMHRSSVIRRVGVASYSYRPCRPRSRFLTLESSRRPPVDFISRSSALNSSSPKTGDDHEGPISDAEWEIRVGRAISILTSTLPDFFKLGLVTRFDASVSSSPFAFVEAVQPSPDLIYARHIRFRYAPPGNEGVMPKVLQIEGLPLYFASAAIVRTSLNALYSDMHVALSSVEVSTLGVREREIKIGLIVSGSSRVGGGNAEWDM
ncbi:hypothetical protein AG1IA_07095 [Rhizoctonia solani AG-1 IA]|uniref:Uncharacterized protein n=1 Tax=Thanatephorus cucumeris (strain AG1-IA) TaxID=983506 RepID=L8WL36_THACA|nr:hypothetical protein AG1IA_07095 [Rhizoctonia solani AG-1 IA]